MEISSQIREFLLNKISQVGGHFGPNLGIIECAIALHKVFNSPIDKIVWDVSHQSLPHKILTGRLESVKRFHKARGASAFTNPYESEHDFFINGHTSTAISQALGTAKARDFKVQSGQITDTEKVIALIGDGALSGGQALESLNNVANLKSQFLIILNDNQMSIDYNSGGLYEGLKQLRESNGEDKNNIFKFLGLDYLYLDDGNNIEKLITALEKVKDLDHPVVLHIKTVKGLGYDIALEKPEEWHYHIPFDIKTGLPSVKQDEKRALLTNNIQETIDFLQAQDDSLIVVPGSPLIGYSLQKNAKNRYLDVGIAEGFGISYGSSIARSGVKTYAVIASSFLQRAYDQIIHDWTLNSDINTNSKHMTLIVLGCGITATDATHNGIFDIPMISNIPGLVYLCPTNDTEYIMMLDWCKNQPFSTAIRLPAGTLPESHLEDRIVEKITSKIEFNREDAIKSHTVNGGIIPKYKINVKSEVIKKGKKVAVFGLGIWLNTADKLVDLIKKKLGLDATLINPRFISHLDTELLESLKVDHDYIISIEDGLIDGGFGSKIASYFANSSMKCYIYGVDKEYVDSVKFKSIINRYKLSEELIFEELRGIIAK